MIAKEIINKMVAYNKSCKDLDIDTKKIEIYGVRDNEGNNTSEVKNYKEFQKLIKGYFMKDTTEQILNGKFINDQGIYEYRYSDFNLDVVTIRLR